MDVPKNPFQVDLATLRRQISGSDLDSSIKSESMSAVQTPTSKKRQNIYANVKTSPSKSSITSGDSARSGSNSDRSDKTDRNHKRSSAKNKRKKSEIENAKSEVDSPVTVDDGDVTDRDKLHNVTCLLLPPIPAGTQKTLTQTDSFTPAPPTAQQVRRDSLLGSLPPLEPVPIAGDITGDINYVLGQYIFTSYKNITKVKVCKNAMPVDSILNFNICR